MASPLTTFLVLLALAFGPSLIYLRWFQRLEKHDLEPMRKVVRAFIWGAIGSIFWVTIINLFIFGALDLTQFGGYLETQSDDTGDGDEFARTLGFVIVVVLMAPIIEEAVKMWGVSSRAGVRMEIDEIEDGMIYGAAIGLGFAATENLLYGYLALDDAGTGAAIATVMVRAISSTLLHTSAAAIAGYGVGRVLVAGEPKGVQYGYYLVAVGLHATFNGAATAGEFIGGDGTSLLSFLFVLGLAWFATDFIRRKIHELDERRGGLRVPPTHHGHGYGYGYGYGYGHEQGRGQGHPYPGPGREPSRRPPEPHTYPGRSPEHHPGPARGSRPRAPATTRPPPHPRSVARTGPAASAKAPAKVPPVSQPASGMVVLELKGPGNRQTQVKVPTSLSIHQLLESARSHYHLPPRRYRLKFSGRFLPFNQTVGQAGLRSNDEVSIIAPG